MFWYDFKELSLRVDIIDLLYHICWTIQSLLRFLLLRLDRGVSYENKHTTPTASAPIDLVHEHKALKFCILIIIQKINWNVLAFIACATPNPAGWLNLHQKLVSRELNKRIILWESENQKAAHHICLLEILENCILFHNQRKYISALYRRHKCVVQVKCSTSTSMLYK